MMEVTIDGHKVSKIDINSNRPLARRVIVEAEINVPDTETGHILRRKEEAYSGTLQEALTKLSHRIASTNGNGRPK